MNIVQVVTLISEDGAFGGPSRVAQSQCAALAELGHNVTLVAAGRSPIVTSTHRDGYTEILFPARTIHPSLGFAGLHSRYMRQRLPSLLELADVAHVHIARDLVTIPAAWTAQKRHVPFVLQPHGMIDHSHHPLAGPLDAVWTRRLLRESQAVLTLTEKEETDIAGIAPGSRTVRVRNGVRMPRQHSGSHAQKPTDAQKILFLARLHERKRPLAFVDMAAKLVQSRPNLKFIIAGPDEGQATAVRAAIAKAGLHDVVELVGSVSPSATDDILASADVYVLPSFNEVFPMTVLEAMRLSVPTVLTNLLGIVDDCRRYGAAAISDGSPEDLAKQVLRVIDEPAFRRTLVDGGLAYINKELDILQIGKDLERIYREAASSVI